MERDRERDRDHDPDEWEVDAMIAEAYGPDGDAQWKAAREEAERHFTPEEIEAERAEFAAEAEATREDEVWYAAFDALGDEALADSAVAAYRLSRRSYPIEG